MEPLVMRAKREREKQDVHQSGHDTQIRRAEARAKEAEARTEQAETRTDQAKTRTDQAETRSERAEMRSEEVIRASEFNYRRLFEAAQEGILILNADTGQISDANPFLVDLLGLPLSELAGIPLWELGVFKEIVSNRAKFEQLRQHGYVRFENLRL